jgi:hypothetical protein
MADTVWQYPDAWTTHDPNPKYRGHADSEANNEPVMPAASTSWASAEDGGLGLCSLLSKEAESCMESNVKLGPPDSCWEAIGGMHGLTNLHNEAYCAVLCVVS